MLNNPYIHAAIVVALSIALAALSVEIIYQQFVLHAVDNALTMVAFGLFMLLQSYVQADRAVGAAKIANGHD